MSTQIPAVTHTCFCGASWSVPVTGSVIAYAAEALDILIQSHRITTCPALIAPSRLPSKGPRPPHPISVPLPPAGTEATS
jgi:hypothetical protein